jgi:glucose/arabinose dehydrogenase
MISGPRWRLGAIAAIALLLTTDLQLALGQTPRGPTPPPPSRESTAPQAFARAITGDTIDTWVDGSRTAVGVVGIATDAPNTPCGFAAMTRLQQLVAARPTLTGEVRIPNDRIGRRFFDVRSADGSSVGATLVGEGLARLDAVGQRMAPLRAAQDAARAAGRGCVWGGSIPAALTEAAQAARPGRAATRVAYPDGFVHDVVAGGISQPTSFAFLPDGRVLAASRNGLVKIFINGVAESTPFADFRDRVNTFWDQGMVSIAVDPDFATNGYVYLYYVYENDPSQYSAGKTARLVRVVADGNAALPGETVLLGSISSLPCAANTDCIPSDHGVHNGGEIVVTPSGEVWLSTGEGVSPNLISDLAFRAQDVNSLAGKLIRVDRDGNGLATNPFWTGTATDVRSKVYAYGFRNPYRLTLRPGSNVPYVGDVGHDLWEEVNASVAGANFGWPCYEGAFAHNGYKSRPICQALYAAGPTATHPAVVNMHHSAGYRAVIGGPFYSGTSYPAAYQGAYFFADFTALKVFTLQVDANHQLVSGPTLFSSDIGAVTDLSLGPEGDVHYVDWISGQLRRIRYAGGAGELNCPVGQFRSYYYTGTSLAGTPNIQRCETAIDYDWGSAGPGGGVGEDYFSALWVGTFDFAAGIYQFDVSSNDGVVLFVDGVPLINQWYTQSADFVAYKTMTAGTHEVRLQYFEFTNNARIRLTWQVDTTPAPSVSISQPPEGTLFSVGQTINYTGSATAGNGQPLTGTALQWQVIQWHCPQGACHQHPFDPPPGTSGTLVIPDHGSDTWYELRLTATDAVGRSTTASRAVHPKLVTLSVTSSPPNFSVTIDGVTRTTPFEFVTTAGSTHTIEAVQVEGAWYFDRWSDGGSRIRDLTLGQTDATLHATYLATSANPAQPRAPFPGWQPSGPPAPRVPSDGTAGPAAPPAR